MHRKSLRRIAAAVILLSYLWMPGGKGGEIAPPNAFTLEVISVRRTLGTRKSVYIYHTHTYEAYEMDQENTYVPTEKWRTADPEHNMIRVGQALARALEDAGVRVFHDTTAYEPPRLSTAYSRSLKGITRAGEEGYDLYLDLHRDSYAKGNGTNTLLVDGKPTARLLILIGKGNGSSLDEKPDWQKNEYAARIIDSFLNARAEGLSRGISLKSGRYNQQAGTPSMLIEVGNNKNTLPEALAAMEPLARAIVLYFDGMDDP